MLDSFDSAINNGAEYIENKNKIKFPSPSDYLHLKFIYSSFPHGKLTQT